jgi:hypothetical protein
MGADDPQRVSTDARLERRVHLEHPEHALRRRDRSVHGDRASPGATPDDGAVDAERVEQAEHDLGVHHAPYVAAR